MAIGAPQKVVCEKGAARVSGEAVSLRKRGAMRPFFHFQFVIILMTIEKHRHPIIIARKQLKKMMISPKK